MNHLPSWLIGLVTAAGVAFLAFRYSNSSWVEIEPGADSAAAPSVVDGGDFGAGASSYGSGGGARSDSRQRTGRPMATLGGGRRAERGGSPGEQVRGVRGGARVMDLPPSRLGGGALGAPVGRVSGLPGGAGSGVSVAGGEIAGSPGAAGGARGGRQEIVDFLAEQGKDAQQHSKDPNAPDKTNQDGVLLDVPLTRETGTQAQDDTAPVEEQDLAYADDGDGVHFDEQSVLAFPDAGNVQGDAGTFSLDVVPDWTGAEVGDYSLVTVRNANDPTNLMRVFKNGKYLRFIFADNTGQERNIGYDMSSWQPGEQHQIAASWGNGTTSLYVDGALVGTNSYDGQLQIRPGTPLYLGSDVPEAGAKGAGAVISGFKAFGSAMTPAQIAGQGSGMQ